jgi:LytS/YehU family sensor histidine kinase
MQTNIPRRIEILTLRARISNHFLFNWRVSRTALFAASQSGSDKQDKFAAKRATFLIVFGFFSNKAVYG